MIDDTAQLQSIRLLVRSVNCWLAASGANYRVAGDVVVTRKDGVTFLALRETATAKIRPPVVNMRS